MVISLLANQDLMPMLYEIGYLNINSLRNIFENLIDLKGNTTGALFC